MTHPYKSVPVRPSEITPKDVYLSRRDFIKAAGVIAGSVALAACAPEVADSGDGAAPASDRPTFTDELGDMANTF